MVTIMVKRTLHIKILGQLWMGGEAAKDLTLAIGTDPFQVDIDPENGDEVCGYVDAHEGDFASITALHAWLIETRLVPSTVLADGWSRQCQDIKSIVVVPWSEDDELRWTDAMFGGMDE